MIFIVKKKMERAIYTNSIQKIDWIITTTQRLKMSKRIERENLSW
jgi:hypothetical protein